ncbi:hypothetical protein EDD98_5976 [Streptomyces sp. PanSC19]|uniref:hypothetical protein n=1 Tax=Streptomyces sp. PanSC19 TaxID=1520455 RepID=UPI000FC05AD1|nr:hypothetical protein [Streptomyces sp. PanSC19]ROQ26346.1 hypothetical protein EDD98_5976 [Streptomyces sp. PanSC19]
MSNGNQEYEDDEHAVAERIDAAHADNPRLAAWLREQRDRFDGWSRDHGGGWDFGERSLDRVEALVREHLTSVDDLFAREHTPLVQVACWYVGEVHNRARGTEWRMDPDPVDSHPWSRRPYVIVPFARLDEYRDPEGIDYDARPRHHPLGSFLTLLREGPASALGALRAELDDYAPDTGEDEGEE